MSDIQSKIQEHLSSRASLIGKELAGRRDYQYLSIASSAEKEAERIVREIRQHEAETVWNSVHEGIPHVFPGMGFLTAKNIIKTTRLYQILKKMPKGALLHAHMDGTVDSGILLRLALEQPAMHVCVPRRLDYMSLSGLRPSFKALPPALCAQATDAPTITSALYIPYAWVPIQKAREEFPRELGGPAGFDSWVLGAQRISAQEAYETHNTPAKIWHKFGSTFVVADGLLGYEPVLESYIRELLRTSIEDGISYIEVRVKFFDKTMVRANGEDDLTHREWLVIFDRVVQEVKADMKAQGRGDEFVGAKIIYSTLRFLSISEIEWYLEDCIELKKEFPHLIVGFDLVAREDSGHPLIYFLEPLLRFRERQKELGLDIPFIFHAGETLGDGDSTDHNLFDAILLGTKRIGHGYSLIKHPMLIQKCKELRIPIEICPISNEILRLTQAMPNHPLPALLNHGVTVALCSDDPSVFGNTGLTYDFFQVLLSSEVTGLITLATLARDSLAHSELEPEEKKIALEKWERRWALFVEEVTKETLPT
ncbi:hypothetical protein BOTBODRAFT_29392 [Botryobasidium botryosum FD-172 SS1]|uniref:adenosine deaminase n=1 Tax=Botryobasidium botryosum (strain FD-172 SS1) TaxID=930990 RepID=A0A067N1P0_BOTB1|nr:hypothetical protein BOTBODRAFT_29392 [Botryobasidium botryosum FD-172 SS1]